MRVRHPRAVEEHLVEVDLAAHVAQRPDIHTRLVQLEQEVRDPGALRHVGIGAGEEHRVARKVRPGGPDLLPGDHPLVTVALGSRGQRGQVRSRARLAEELAPHLLVAHDGGQEPQPLLLTAVGEERGRGEVEPQRVQPSQVVRPQDLVHPARHVRRHVETPVLDGPGRHHQPRRPEDRVPRLVVRSRAHGPHLGRPALPPRLHPGCRDVSLHPCLHRGDDILGARRRSDVEPRRRRGHVTFGLRHGAPLRQVREDRCRTAWTSCGGPRCPLRPWSARVEAGRSCSPRWGCPARRRS